MANAKTSKTNEASSNTQAWPQRFGSLKDLQIKSGRRGPYAILTIDCGKFEQTAFAFGDKLVNKMKAAGVGARVWVKGPIEDVQRINEAGRPYTEQQLKVVYAKDISASNTADSEAPKAEKKAARKTTAKAAAPASTKSDAQMAADAENAFA